MNSLVTQVLDRLVEEIESGKNPWRRSWKQGAGGLPLNATTQRAYRGINTLLLWLEQNDKGYGSNQWASFKQWGGAGRQVRKGEKGTPIIFWKMLERGEGEDKSSFPMMRLSWVFNVAQLDGAEAEPPAAQPSPDERHARAQAWCETLGIVHTNGAPAYSPSLDRLEMPPASDFTSLDEFWSTYFHEIVHWTGHKSRLNRPMIPITVDTLAYAAEELIAEIGAAFMGAEFGIDTEQNNGAYLRGWLRIMPDKRQAILTAASQAAKAFEFLTRQPEAKELAA